MRRLGQALDRKVMTLYRYAPSKDALLDGVVALHAYRLFFGFLHGQELHLICDNYATR
jgi:hypothetical protein